MSSKKSSIVAGAGLLTGIFTRMVAEVKKAGGTDDDIHRLTTPDANGVWEKIATVIVEAGKKVTQVFTMMVDYGRSVQDSIAAGKYDYKNEDITEKNFPPIKDEAGKKEVQFTLYHFGKDVDSDFAIAEMLKDGKRPATLRELLAFGEANPELQREFPIIALLSVWVSRSGGRDVPCLNGCDSERDLVLGWCGSGWDGYCRFLGVSK